MGDLAAAEGEAEAAAAEGAAGPRMGTAKGAALAFAGSAVLSFALTLLAVLVETGGPWLVVAGALAYSLALLVWAGLWKRPLTVAAIIAASLAGLVAGYLLATGASSLLG